MRWYAVVTSAHTAQPRFARHACVFALLAGVVMLRAGRAEAPPTEVLSFASAADTYVDAAVPGSNFNASTQLKVDGSPVRIAYVRFAVTGVAGRPVQHARLRLGATGTTAGSGGSVHLISDTAWDETTLIWANHPAVDGPAVATLGPITTAGAVVEVNLDGAISGDGVYNLAIDSTSPDGAGYNSAAATSGQKPTLVLTVASAPSPMAHIVQPPTGATFFDGDPITLQATAVDADGSDLGAGVTWTSSVQGLLGTGATLTTPLSVGSHTVTASVTGNAGTQAMDRVTVTVRPPPAADTEPLVAITAPADAAVVLAGSPVTFSGTANDLEDGPLGARLVWTSDRDGTLGTGASITKALSPGPHRITAAGTDTGEHVGTVTGDGTYDLALVANSSDEALYRSRETTMPPKLVLTLTGNPPTVAITAPPTGAVFFAGAPVTLAGTARDVEDGDLTTRIHWTSSLDGLLGDGPSVTASSLRVGTHTITAAVADSDGRAAQAQATVRMRGPNLPPRVTITAPADGSAVPAGTAVTLAATAADDFDRDLALQWTSSRDGALGAGATVSAVLTEGVHTLTAAVTDSDGATSSAAVTLTVTPTPPVVTIATPAPGTRVFVGTSLTFSATALDATDGDVSGAIRWTSDLDGPIGGGASVTTSALRPGTHTVTAAATDRAR